MLGRKIEQRAENAGDRWIFCVPNGSQGGLWEEKAEQKDGSAGEELVMGYVREKNQG